MSANSGIEWTDATWNPIVGCSVVSPGCTNCYAMKMAARIEACGTAPHYAGMTKKVNGNAVWTGKVAMAPEHILTQPLRWKKGRKIFVNSMGDLFHEAVPDEWIDRVFAVMALAPQHTFQVLTKRANRMREYCTSDATVGRTLTLTNLILQDGGRCETKHVADGLRGFQLPNVWLGVSAEDQERADERIPDLLATPAAVRFVSCEPLLGPVDLRRLYGGIMMDGAADVAVDSLAGRHAAAWHGRKTVISHRSTKCAALDWVICGGEIGPGARPMHPDWARSVRDQCAAAGTPFFFKQWGAWVPVDVMPPDEGRQVMARLGKKAAGALLDGREHREVPT